MTYRHLVKGLMVVVWACIMTACGPKNIVVLVPDPEGAVGRVTVSNPAGSVEIDTPNQATTISDASSAPTAPSVLAPTEIDRLFAGVLINQPEPPVHYLLYFEKDATRLRPDSRKLLPDVIAAIRDRSSEHISVVGHTDRLGDKSYNLMLSRRRAEAVKDLLIERGVPEAFIETTSHGEENPIVPTADNVGNARNRRVEVVVR